MSTRDVLPDAQRSDVVQRQGAEFHADVVAHVKATVAAHAVVVVGMAQNPFVRRARRALTDAKVAFEYVEYGSYVSKWHERLAIKLWSGYPTYPQVFVNQTLIGGYRELQAMLDAGELSTSTL